jgi:hypothetical protein
MSNGGCGYFRSFFSYAQVVIYLFHDWVSLIRSRSSLDVDREGAILEVHLPCIGAMKLEPCNVALLFPVCQGGHVNRRVNNDVQPSLQLMRLHLHYSNHGIHSIDPLHTFSSTSPTLPDPSCNGQLGQILLLW